MFSRKCQFRPGVSCFVLGPRGTGKTYWLHQLYPGALFVDLLEARTFNLLAADPQRLENLIRAAPHGLPVIIDEIQKLPALLDEVHRLIETQHVWFILTGSSARKLRRGGVNLLGGRAVTKQFHPLTATELGDAFDLGKALKYDEEALALARSIGYRLGVVTGLANIANIHRKRGKLDKATDYEEQALAMARLAGAAEVFIVLRVLGAPVSPIQAVFIYSVIVVINTVFFILPGQWGVTESASLLLLQALGQSAAIGLSLGVIRRIRKLVFVALAFGLYFVDNKGKGLPLK